MHTDHCMLLQLLSDEQANMNQCFQPYKKDQYKIYVLSYRISRAGYTDQTMKWARIILQG